MKAVIGFIKQAWLLSLVGIIALSLIVYYLAYFFDLSVIVTGGVIGGLFILWAAYHLWQAFKAKKQNQHLLEQLAEENRTPEDLATQEEIEHLDTRLQEAVQALQGLRVRGADFTKNKQYIYQLPWYIIIGPPGSGKTTLLANSNLKFPLSKEFGKEALLGVGGTRNCDWWFTNDAVLLDTAGRYTTQDSNKSVDQGAWFGFLDLLKKYRGHQPINGVVIAVSIDDLMRLSQEDKEKHTNAIRQRITELYEQLNISIPVYMMFTKADLVAGFNEFFDDLNRNEREQVWGMTFPLIESSDVDTVEMFASEFSLLEQHIHQQLIKKLDDENNLEKRQAIYTFPSQFSSLKQQINQFLTEIFEPNKFTAPFMLRGVYFTSATQEGSPIDRIMGSVASGFGIAREQVSSFSGKGKSYFINHLLKNVVFSEAGLAGTNQQQERRLQWFQMGIASGIGAASLLLAVLWINSYQNNKELISTDFKPSVDKMSALKAYESKEAGEQLKFLDSLGKVSRYEKTSVFNGIGLYQGQLIARRADERYQESLKNFFKPIIKEKLEWLMEKQSDPLNPAALFQTLKAYVYLSGDSKPESWDEYQPATFSAVDWNEDQEIDNEDRMFSQHLNVLLTEKLSNKLFIPDNQNLDKARTLLKNKSSEIIYSKWLRSSLKNGDYLGFDIKNQSKLGVLEEYFTLPVQEISPLFTFEGYKHLFLPEYKKSAKSLVNEKWVMKGYEVAFSAKDDIALSMFERYQDDYIRVWNQYLRKIKVRSFKDNSEASDNLQQIVSTNLLKHMVSAISKQTDFIEINKTIPLINKKFELKEQAKRVTEEFSGFINLNKHEKGKEKLSQLNEMLKQVAKGIHRSNKEASGALEAVEDLDLLLNDFPNQLKHWFIDVVPNLTDKVKSDISVMKEDQVNGLFKNEICATALKLFNKKYPFSLASKDSVSVGDFVGFFGSNGTASNFKQEHFSEKKSVDLAKLPQVNTFYEDVRIIQEAFFPNNGGLKYRFKLKLLSKHPPSMSQLQLSMSRTTKTLFLRSSTSKELQEFWWTGDSSLMFKKDATSVKPINQTDPWMFFRWIQRDKLTLPSPDRFTFQITPSPVSVLSTFSHLIKSCKKA